MERSAYLSLMKCADAAAEGLLAFICRLEADGHIKTGGEAVLSAVLLPELLAYCCAVQERQGRVAAQCLGLLMPLLHAKEADEALISKGILRRAADFANAELLPGAYMGLCRFDAMAQEYDGAFYTRMHTENPGALSRHYLALFEAAWRLSGGSLSDAAYGEAADKLAAQYTESKL